MNNKNNKDSTTILQKIVSFLLLITLGFLGRGIAVLVLWIIYKPNVSLLSFPDVLIAMLFVVPLIILNKKLKLKVDQNRTKGKN